MKTGLEIVTGIVLVIVFTALAATSATQKSATIDEFAHMPAGLYAWKTRDFSLYPKTPPLGRMLMNAPVLLLNPQVDTHLGRYRSNAWRPWAYGSSFLQMNFGRYGKMLLASRLSVVFLGVVTCVLVWVMARISYGKFGGLTALAACALSPTLIAHSRLVTTDAAAALTSLLFIMAFLFYVDRPGWRRVLLLAAAAGFSVLVKFSCILWAALALASPLIVYLPGLTEVKARPRFLVALFHVALAGGLMWLLVCGAYLAKDMGPHNELWFGSRAFRAAGPVLSLLPMPLDFMKGIDRQLHDVEKGEWSKGNFLLGKWYTRGKPYYYAVAVSAKEPLPHLLLMLAAVLLVLLRWPWNRDEVVLLSFVILWFVISSLAGSLQIGIRYLLPVYPAAFILMGRAGWQAFAREESSPADLNKKAQPASNEKRPAEPGRKPAPGLQQVAAPGPGKTAPADTKKDDPIELSDEHWSGNKEAPGWRRIAKRVSQVPVLAMVAWMLMIHVFTWPHYISFFNLAWGGPEDGRRVLLDSNLDWGQDLPSLKKWMEKNEVRAVDLAYFGHDDPARFAISFNLPGRDSDNRYIAISANLLMGKVYPMTFLRQDVYNNDPLWKEIGRYRTEDSVANAGHSILIYEKFKF